MKRNGKLALFVAGAMLSVVMVGCKKNTSTNSSSDNDTDVTTAKDQSLAEGLFNEANDVVDQASESNTIVFLSASSGDSKSSSLDQLAKSSCATITKDTVSIPHLITIDFGTTNCQCNDGKYRRGKILVSYMGHHRDSASTRTITFDNYFVNDNQVLGSRTVVNNGHNANGNLTFTITVDGQIIKANNEGTVTWQSNRTREWIEGESTQERNDDVFLITGTSSGTKANGVSFTANITTPLRKAVACHWFDSGVVEVSPQGRPTRIINYGSGTCDDQATVTINGNVHDITLY